MIFLSASSPSRESSYNATINRLATRDAIIAFARCCAEHDLPFYFGGHPAITALIYQTLQLNAKSYLKKKAYLYQSKYFENDVPQEMEAFNYTWTPQVESDKEKSINEMRRMMLQAHNDTDIIVVIGGKEGVLAEVKQARHNFPKAKIYPIAGTGGAALKLFKELKNMEYWSEFRKESCEDIMFEELFHDILIS